MHRSSSFLLSIVVAIGLFAAGCDATGPSGSSGTLELRMSGSSTTKALRTASTTDGVKASDVDTAQVTINEVSIVPAEDTSDGGSTETGVQVISGGDFTVDLKDLQDGLEDAGLDTLMAETEIPAGKYSQLRLVTADEAQVSFTDTKGTEPVRIASGPQTGLKINFDPFTIESADDRVELTVNWDVEESLRGNRQDQYVITPAINDAIVNVMSAAN